MSCTRKPICVTPIKKFGSTSTSGTSGKVIMSDKLNKSTPTTNWDESKSKLSPLEWQVTQEKVTERPFSNRYNRHWEAGSYHCVVCNKELFKSDTKFESKSGWPAFSNVIENNLVELKPDLSHVGANLLLLVSRPDLARTEVSCSTCKSHLGHLFKDGPKPTGLRYCINSSSLKFVPLLSTSSSTNGDQEKSKSDDLSTELSSKTSQKPIVTTECQNGKICFFPNNTAKSNFFLSSSCADAKPSSQCQIKQQPKKKESVLRIWNKNTTNRKGSAGAFEQISTRIPPPHSSSTETTL